MTTIRPTVQRRGAHQRLALVLGVLFVVVGIAGFGVTGFEGWVEHDHTQTLVVFAVNPLHNVVHILIGLLGILLWRTPSGSRTFGWLLVIGYGATLLYGVFVVDNEEANFLNINWADNWLHLAAVVIGLVIALLPYRTSAQGADR
ncbi:DUF4383 domain-containing protein [Georgenia sp. 311]|uniref:DUF4383 domain-containing protein n=1 Tax=Georgenia sp. 311 TaxID=2585134 RepID=UPI001111CB2A|nr:DUF4383 domain-containing protein [Georgenia sp. 311]TNC19158.1 DUF4383 domain-containing protein [Georgenia sp. 311]